MMTMMVVVRSLVPGCVREINPVGLSKNETPQIPVDDYHFAQ